MGDGSTYGSASGTISPLMPAEISTISVAVTQMPIPALIPDPIRNPNPDPNPDLDLDLNPGRNEAEKMDRIAKEMIPTRIQGIVGVIDGRSELERRQRKGGAVARTEARRLRLENLDPGNPGA